MSKQISTKPFYNTEIPDDWSISHLGELGVFSKGKGILKEQVIEEGLPCIRYGEIYTTHDFIIKNFKSFINDDLAKESKEIKKGDILFAGSGETVEEIGKAVAYLGNEKAYAGGDVIILSTKKDVDAECLSYILETDFVRRQKRVLGQGNSVVHIYSSDLSKVKIPLPPLPEQKAIAQVLSTWDEAITKTQTLINQKELSKKWLMQNLLTGKKRLKGFEEDFKEYKVDQLFDTIARYVEWNENDLYKLVSIRRRFGGLFLRGDLLGEQISVKKLKRINTGDFLISKRQVSHGAWAVVPSEFHDAKVSDEYDCLQIKDENKLISSFWLWFCQLPILRHYAFLDSNGVHIEKLIFDFDQFKKRKVSIPKSIKEQTAIAQVLVAADTEIQLLKTKTERLKEQKKGLMQMLLTGKQRLNISKK